MNGAEWSEISLSPNVLGERVREKVRERGLNLKGLSGFSLPSASLPAGGVG
ncbi:MAG: hypothetical protein BWY57_01919 [Betaproteobacteria bacterium ADurb.Bin341]|nr:MAG: hypothetical protein BWY57_01919 [Betaproteobacteria bacterium ADurb.Bin341]